MTVLLVVIAIPGIAAVLLRLSSAVFRMARYSVEWFVARQLSDTRAARGDISGMTEANKYRRNSRMKQLQGLLQVLLWSGALVIPLLLPGTFLIYALYGLLWLAPRSRAVDRLP